MKDAIGTQKKKLKRNRGYYLGMTGNILIFGLIVALFSVYPLYLRSGYSYIAAGKYFFFLNLGRYTAIIMGFFAAVYFAAWGMNDREIKAFRPLLPLDLSVLFFALSAIISFAFSNYKNVTPLMGLSGSEGALRGCSGWYMGLLTVLIMVMFYFVISRFFKFTMKFAVPVLVTAVIVTVWGILNRFGLSFIGKDGVDPQYIATIGNINWYCGYMTVVLPILLGIYFIKGAKARLLLTLPVICGFAVILLNGSDSGVFALFITFLVLFVYSAKDEEKLSVFSELLLMFSAVNFGITVLDKLRPNLLSFHGFVSDVLGNVFVSAAVLVLGLILFAFAKLSLKREKGLPALFKRFAGRTAVILTVLAAAVLITLIAVNTKLGGTLPLIGRNPFFIFDGEWGTRRSIDWTVGLRNWWYADFLHKIVGVGPDCFWFHAAENEELSAVIARVFGESRLTNAHCELLTVLVNTGVVGAVAFLAVVISFFKVFVSGLKNRPELIVFILPMVMYLSNNLISFEQLLNTPLLFAIMGIGASALIKER